MESPLQQLLTDVQSRLNGARLAAQPINEAAETALQDALRSPLLPDVLAVLLHTPVQGCVPDAEHVASCKQRGAAAFGRAQHRQAARLFSEGLRYCEEGTAEGAQLAARLYCNRALCLTKLRQGELDLEAALQDSRSAAELDPAYAKAHYRLASVLKAMGRGGAAEARRAAARAAQLLWEQGAAGVEAAEAEALAAELEAAAAADAAESEAAGGEVPEVDQSAGAADEEVPASEPAAGLEGLLQSAGGQLAVQQTDDAGRCLVAAAALPVGADVLREQPYAHALTKAGRRSVCTACMAPLAEVGAPYYCPRCPLPAYCSAACRDADSFHRPGGPECGLPWSVLLPAEAVAALRLARRLREDGAQQRAEAEAEDGKRGAPSAAASQVLQLGAHWEEMEPEQALQLAALAAVAHAAWQQAAAEHAQADGAAASSSSSGGGAGLAPGDVLAALARLQINGLAVVPPERAGSQDRLGVAVYPVASLMNHSCAPNVAARFEGSSLVVRTVEPVEAGAALLHCYGPQAGEMAAAQRQRMLQQHYHFLCACRACRAVATPAGQLADTAPAGLRCPGGGGARCEGAALPACAVPEGILHRYALPAGSGACCACGAELSQQQWEGAVLPELRAAAEAHAAAAAQLERLEGAQQAQQGPSEAAQQAVRALRQVLRQRQAHLHPHSVLLGATHSALAHAWHLLGSHEPAAQHLRHSLAILQHAYPPGSTAVAFAQRQLAQMLRLAAAAAAAGGSGGAAAAERHLAEARQVDEAAEAVLSLHFGPA